MADLKVLHIFKEYFPDKVGGVQESIRQISKYTTCHGVDNTVLTVSATCDPAVLPYPEAKVIRYKTLVDVFSTPFSIGFLRNFNYHCQANDILHFHFPWPFAELIYLISVANKPVIVTYHSDIVRQRMLKKAYAPFFKMFFKRVNVIVATSQQYLQSSQDLKPFRNKCVVNPLSIGSQRFAESNAGSDMSVKRQYGEDFFLFVGVLRYYKGLHYLLEAMRGIDKKLVIVGAGPEEKRLKQRACELGLDNVIFAGYVDDDSLAALFRLSRAFVFPSCARSEAFGIALLEAATFAKPMISTELGTGTSFVNLHQETGFVVPPKNAPALHDALRKLSENELLCKKFGFNAKKRSAALFDGEVVGEKYIRIYQELFEAYAPLSGRPRVVDFSLL
ncbi:MAG: glycosyltransferase [Deltaproteobacteria bacterium]|nr:glycosyltransferase [Deltaproteobacteria bacterium]